MVDSYRLPRFSPPKIPKIPVRIVHQISAGINLAQGVQLWQLFFDTKTYRRKLNMDVYIYYVWYNTYI